MWTDGNWEALDPIRLLAVSDEDNKRPKQGYYMEICVDRGCGRSCTGEKIAEALGYQVEETAQSKRGHYFTGPGNETYPNKGKVQLSALDEASRACITSFNVAQGVDQSLGSVADTNDANNLVIFDKEGSGSLPGNSPEAAAIRKAMARASRMTKFHRRKNTFSIPLWMQPQPKSSDRPVNTPVQRRGP